MSSTRARGGEGIEAIVMMFLVRSAFWLSIVVAHMPLDGSEALRAVDETKGAIVAGAVNAAKAKCAQESVSCQAFVAAAGTILTPSVPRPSNARAGTTHQSVKTRTGRPSVDSLSAADLATPWRGRAAKSGA
jgi:hypothetical protein